MARSIIIIGAGIGGLSTGCYAQANGYATHILEMHAGPGGLCTAWKRNGYTIDGCIHNLAGSSEASPLHRIWRELGVVPTVPMHGYDELVCVARSSGEPLKVYTNLDRLERHMTRLFPDDAEPIAELIDAARSLRGFDLLGLAVAGPWERAKGIARAVPLLAKYASTTLEQYATRFKDPFLRQAFPTLMYDWPQQSLLMLLSFLAGVDKGDLGWPVGGSSALASAIERRFLSLGGTVQYNTKVDSILVENNRAVGVRLSDGSQLKADIVVSNAYGPSTIFDMLGGRYINRAIRSYYSEPEDRVEMGLHVSLGVARTFPSEPHAMVLPLDAPVEIDHELRHRLYLQIFDFDQSLAPRGKSVLKVLLATSYRRWAELRQTPEKYRAEKDRIAKTVIGLVAKAFPGLDQQIEVVDVATPMTSKEFTGNANGFRFSVQRMALALLLRRKLSQTLPHLKNFYMVGQWAGMPGVPMVAAMGRDVVRQICRRDGKHFVAPECEQEKDSRSTAITRPDLEQPRSKAA